MMMSVAETAAWLDISPVTLMRLVKSDKGPACMKVGRRPRFRQEDLLEWIGHDPEGDLPELLTLLTVANNLGMTHQWVRTQVLAGELEAIRIGGQWRITVDAHEKWKAKAIKPY